MLGASQVRLVSSCVDTALSMCNTSSAGQPACLAANSIHLCPHLPWCVMQQRSGSWRVFRGVLVQRPATTSLHCASYSWLHAFRGTIEPSTGCSHGPRCQVDTGLLWPPVGCHFGLPGCVPEGLPVQLVCRIGGTQPVSRPLALPASRRQPSFRVWFGPSQTCMLGTWRPSPGAGWATAPDAPPAMSCDTAVLRLPPGPGGRSVLIFSSTLGTVPKPMLMREGRADLRQLEAVRGGDRLRRPHGSSVAWTQKLRVPCL